MRYRCTFIIILNAAICLWASPVWQIHMQLHCKQTHMPSCTVYTDYRSSRAVSMVSLFKIKMNPVILCWRLRQSLFASFHGCPCFCLAVKDTKRTYTTEMTDQTGCHMFLIIIVKHLTFTNILPKHSQLAAGSGQWIRGILWWSEVTFFHFTLNNCQQNALRVPFYRNQRLGYHLFF